MRIAALVFLLLAQAAEEPADTRLDEANREAARKVVRTFAKRGAMLSNQLRGLRKEDVVVVGGLFDFFQELLAAYRVPFTVITPAELEHHPLPRPERMIFFLDCHLLDRKFPGSQPAAPRPGPAEAARRLARVLEEAGLDGESAPGRAIRERFKEVATFAGSDYSLAGLKRLAGAVRAGAWVMSSDWAVLALERAFPGAIRWTGRTTFEETVEVQPTRAGRRDPLLEGVFEAGVKPRWWLETESYLFACRGRFKPLIESRALGARYSGNRNVAVLFEPGKGRVLHMISHGWLQKGRAHDAAVMQRLLLNYVIAKSLQNYRREFPPADK